MAANDSEWWMYTYKVQPCPLQERHDWSTCPYAHRGERAARRCPRTYSYTAEPCPEYNKTGVCARGADCPMAHAVWESWLHPSRFRTQFCCFGTSCKRRICFFAHDASQIRAATAPPGSAAAAAAATGAPIMRRTQAVVPANLMGYGTSTSSAAAAARSSQAAMPGSMLAAGGQAAVLTPSPGSMQTQQLAPAPAQQQQQQQPQPQLFTGVAAGPTWVYTGSGSWLQAAPHMGQPVMVPGGGMQGSMQMVAVQGVTGAAGVGGSPGGPIVPANQAVLSGLASGLSGLSLQEQQQQDLTGSSQAHACVPAMLPLSPSRPTLHYQPASDTYPMHAQAAVAASPGQAPPTLVYAPVMSPAAGLQPQLQQQQYLIAPGGALVAAPGTAGGMALQGQGPVQQWP